jgi:hypothetical protein
LINRPELRLGGRSHMSDSRTRHLTQAGVPRTGAAVLTTDSYGRIGLHLTAGSATAYVDSTGYWIG